jgi:glycolate oxidase
MRTRPDDQEPAMKREALQQIIQKYGQRAADSRFECSLYSQDLAPVPAILVDPLFNTLPDLVIRPASVEEVSEILKAAYTSDIPVTPRAGASTSYFDSIPVKGGIVIDLNLINGVVRLKETEMTVTVKAGTTWSDLEEYLNARGLSSKSFPSSAPVATVGGWFCMKGYGIGSLKYGNLLSHVKAIEVVLPWGEIRRLSRESDPPLEWFFASEGTLGVITEVELEVRKLNPMKHFLLHFSDVSEMVEILAAAKEAKILPYNLHFADPQCVESLHKLEFSPGQIKTGCLLAIDYEGTADEMTQVREWIAALIKDHPKMDSLPEEIADSEWAERFMALRLKRGGPSILGGEIWLPIDELMGYLADMQKMAGKYHFQTMTYGHLVTRQHITVMTMFYVDEERTIDYILNFGLVRKIHDVGNRHGGSPYGVGLWNTPYIGRIFQPRVLVELRKRKKRKRN